MSKIKLKNLVIRNVMIAALAAALTACGGGGGGSSAVPTGSTSISGSVGDGPIVGGTVTIKDRNGDIITTTTSDASANYSVNVEISSDKYPLTIEATGGTDLVTGRLPDFMLSSILYQQNTGGGQTTLNINPFTTLIYQTAATMPGGASEQNVNSARQYVFDVAGFGLDPNTIADPATTSIDAANVAMIVKPSEALAEMFRRTHEIIRARDGSVDLEDVIAALAADLSDGIIDGQGATGTQARISATATVVSAQVLIESLGDNLKVDGSDATASLNNSITSTHPAATVTTVPANAAALAQAGAAVGAASAIAPSIALSTIASVLESVQPGASAQAVNAILPADSSSDLDNAINSISVATNSQVNAVNEAVRNPPNDPPQNRAPVISGNPATSVTENTAYSFKPVATDADGDKLTFSIAKKPAWASFSSSTGRLSGTPGNSNVGTTSGIVISVSDGTVKKSLPAFNLTVNGAGQPANTLPVISGTPASSVIEDSAYDFRPSSSDADGDTLTFSIANKPAWASFRTRNGRLFGTPDNSHAGATSGIVISVTDDEATVALPAFSITVVNSNDAPVISGSPATSVAAGGNYSFSPGASDADGDKLTFSISNKPSWADFSTTSGILSGSPSSNDAKTYSGIVIRVSDGAVTSSLPSFNIVVSSSSGGGGGGQGTLSCSLSTVLCVDDTSGSNQEFASIQSAVDSAGPGDTVQVFDGSYNGFRIDTSGTSSKPLTVKAAGNNVNITGTEPTSSESIHINNSSYVTVEGFNVVRNGKSGYGIATHGANGNNPMRGLVIRNNTVSNSSSTNIYLSQVADSLVEGNISYGSKDSHGIYLSNGGADNTTLRGNRVYNNGVNGIHFNGDESVSGDGLHTGLIIEGNIVYDNEANGLDMDGVQSSIIRNNLMYGNGRHAVRGFDIDSAGGPAKLTIVNNTLVVPGGGSYPIKLTQDDGGHVIFNNILLNQGGGGSISVESSNLTTADNLVVNELTVGNSTYSLTGWQGLGYGSGSALAPGASTLFSNPSSGDYQHKAGSPAIDNGRASLAGANAPGTDILGLSRPAGNGYDIGAYEAGASGGTDGGGSTSGDSVNNAPVISGNPATTIAAGSAYSFLPSSSDADGDDLVFSITNKPSWASFRSKNGKLLGTPGASDADVTKGIIITVSDGQDSAALPAFNLTVTASSDTGGGSGDGSSDGSSDGSGDGSGGGSGGGNDDVIPTGINQYYISPNGSNSGNCNAAAPCKTFEKAVSMLAAGDELILKDGYYSLSQNGTLNLYTDNGNDIPRSGQMPSGISAQKQTVVRAENPGQVSIEGGLRIGLTFDKVQYITVYGLTFHGGGSIYNGDYITVKNSGFEGGFGIGTIDHNQGNTYNLIEDVWLWGKNIRSLGSTYRGHHNTWRRVLLRGDGCDQNWCGEGNGNYSPGITVYNSHDTVMENVIVVDRILGSNRYGYADFSTAQHDSSMKAQPEGEFLGRNSWLGCMSINSEDAAIQFEADYVESGTTATIKDFTALNTSDGVWLDPAHRPYGGISHFEVDSLYVYPENGSSNSFYIGCDTAQSKDKGCNHAVTNVYAGRYTGNMSSVVPQSRYGSSTPLWPWANEERIKAEMCQSESRGFCSFNGTISQYVMSY